MDNNKINNPPRKPYFGAYRGLSDVKSRLRNQKIRSAKNVFKSDVRQGKNYYQFGVFLKSFSFSLGGLCVVLSFIFLIVSVFYSFYLMTKPAQSLIFSGYKPDNPFKIVIPPSTATIKDIDSFAMTLDLNQQPWVLSAKIKTYPPQVLGYFIQTRIPYFILSIDKQEFLVDYDLLIIAPKLANEYNELPRLSLKGIDVTTLKMGSKLESFLLDSGLEWLRALAKSEILPLEKVKNINISDPHKFMISTSDPDLVVIAKSYQISDQLENLAAAMPALAIQPRITMIDIRVQNRVIFK